MKDKWKRKNPITKNGHSEKVFVWIIFALPSRWLMLLLLLILRFSRKVPSRFMKSAITTKKIWNETSGFVPFNWSFDMINHLKKVLQGGMRQLQNFEWISFSSLYFWNDNGSKWIETSLKCCCNKFPIESYV